MAFLKHHQVRGCTSTGQEMPKTHARCMYRKAVGVLGLSDSYLFGINPKKGRLCRAPVLCFLLHSWPKTKAVQWLHLPYTLHQYLLV